jgi:putative oxidoreductase
MESRSASERFAYPMLRVSFALIMLTHGLPKLLGVPHGTMADPLGVTTKVIGSVLHLPAPGVLAFLIALLETVGASMLAFGIQTRLVATLMTIELAVACYVHAPVFAWADRGMEMPLLMGVVALYFALRGGGPFSVDRRLGWEGPLQAVRAAVSRR